jgi:DHA1 family 2-module integral membrane pump EmrD-like MFS transporter
MRLNTASLVFLAFLLSANTLGAFSTDVYIPALPIIAEKLHTSESLAQFTISIYFFSFSISPLIFGPLSDSVGRKTIIVGGLVTALPATLFCYLATNIYLLILGRFFQGFGLGAVISGSRAVAPDIYKGRDLARVMSLLTMAVPLFLSVAPVIGGYTVHYFSWQTIFLILFIYTLILLIYYVFVFTNTNNEDKHEHKSVKSWTAFNILFKNKRFMLYGTYPAIIFSGISAYITVSPFLYQEVLGVSAKTYGELALLVGATILIGATINTKLIKICSPQFLLKINYSLMAIAGLALLLVQIFGWLNFYSLLACCTIFFLATPFGFPNANSQAYASIDKSFGAAGSLISFFSLFSAFLMSGIISFMPADTVLPLAIIFILAGLLGKFYIYKAQALEQE